MDGTSTGSFIPKVPTSSGKPRTVKRVYILTYIAYIMFFGALCAAGGVYAYTVLLNHRLHGAQAALDAQRNKFNQSDLVRVQDEAARLTTAYTLLNSHFFVYSLLASLEQSTIRSVQISKFSVKPGSVPNTYTVSFVASANSINDLQFQRATYMGDHVLSGADYSAIELSTSASTGGQSGQPVANFSVTKTFKATDLPLDPSLYSQIGTPVTTPAANLSTSTSAFVGSAATSATSSQ